MEQAQLLKGPLFLSCRFRGFIEDGGIDEDGKFISIRGTKYLQVQLARLAFVVVFEVRAKTDWYS